MVACRFDGCSHLISIFLATRIEGLDIGHFQTHVRDPATLKTGCELLTGVIAQTVVALPLVRFKVRVVANASQAGRQLDALATGRAFDGAYGNDGAGRVSFNLGESSVHARE